VASLTLGALAAGCASEAEWTTWKIHPAHFASGNHAMFSLRNTDRSVRVTRADLDTARNESWWGKALTVEQSQIVER
jgi:hypothetical protein